MTRAAARRALSLCAALAACSAAWAQSPVALVKELSGKVETMPPGKAWAPAAVGQKLPKGTQVATGFRSSATLALGDSLLAVKPLTQMSVEELVKTGNLVKTEVYLRVGKVKAEVVTTASTKNDFKLKSPTATASVRGTSFEFDGDTLYVERGTVVMIAASGAQRPVKAGEASEVSAAGAVSAPRDEAAAAGKVESVRQSVEAQAQPAGASTIEVPAAAESAAAVQEVAPEPVPVAIVEANGTVTLILPGQAYPAGFSGALLVVSSGPPVLVYPAGATSVALNFGGSVSASSFPAGQAFAISTMGAVLPAASYPAGTGSALVDWGVPAPPSAAYPAGLSADSITLTTTFPATFPAAPSTGGLGVSVE